MIFSNGDGVSLELQVLGYQFPDEKSDWDPNWLIVAGSITHPRGSWRFTDPCLTTFELEQLAKWFEDAAQGKPNPAEGYFTEPCLEFRLVRGPQLAIEVILAHECAPPWLTGDERLGGFALQFPIPPMDPMELARAARKFLVKFPERDAGRVGPET